MVIYNNQAFEFLIIAIIHENWVFEFIFLKPRLPTLIPSLIHEKGLGQYLIPVPL